METGNRAGIIERLTCALLPIPIRYNTYLTSRRCSIALGASAQPDISSRNGLFGLFESPYMIFRLRNAAPTCQLLVDEVIWGLVFVTRIRTTSSSHPKTKRSTCTICFNASMITGSSSIWQNVCSSTIREGRSRLQLFEANHCQTASIWVSST